METGGGSEGFGNTGFSMRAGGGTAVNPYINKPTLSVAEMEGAETETITGKYNSIIIAKNISMDIIAFNRYNPLFDNQIATNGKYELILPQLKMRQFLSTKYQILNECVQFLLGDSEIPNNTMQYKAKKEKRVKS